MNIGALEARDVPRAAAMLSSALGPSWTEAALEGERTRTGALALALAEEGTLAGVALGWVVAGELEISAVAVDPARRRAGLGRALLRAMLETARGRGAEDAFLEVRAGNVAAIALYRGAGFALGGRRARYYADGEDALLFRARL